uniref:Uncharacterized protein n=1 Tax=Ciona savignyi TaxID=51511 RepID=H2ZJT2_CIOSA
MQTCDQVPREYYKCLLCDFQDHEQRAIEYHIQETHVEKFITPQPEEKAQRRASKLGRLKVLMYEESSSAADVIDKEMGSDYDLSMEDDEEIPVKTKSTPKSKSSKRSPRTPASDRKQSRTTYTALCKPLSAAFEWAYLRRRDLEKRYPLLYPEWTPTNTLGETQTGDVIKKCKLRNISPSFAVDSTTLNKT